MKKFTSFFLIISVVFLAGLSAVYAENGDGPAPDGGAVSSETVPADNRGRLEGITYSSDGVYEAADIAVTGFAYYYITELTDPLRIVIDMKDVTVPDEQGIIQADGEYVKNIRYSQFTRRIARVVLDVAEGYDYSIVRTDNGLTAYVCKYMTPDELRKDSTIPLGPEHGINASGSGADETVAIDLGGYDEYSISRLTDPERLVVTIPEAYVSSRAKQFDFNGRRISSVEYAPAGKSGAEITIGLKAQLQYKTEVSEGKLNISFSVPSYKNITYSNSGDRVYFLIEKAALTKGTKDLKPLYKDSFDESGRVYTVTFPSKNADLNEGILDINDCYLESFEVKNNGDGTTSLVFTGRPGNSYLVYTRDSGDTAVTVIRPAAGGQRIVAIDAGHGGTAAGARYGDLYEKDLNLDIARRLESLLKSKGVQTYMIRSDDTNVDNYERAYLANKLGAALYLSIHNNAAGSGSVKGTMTLCYPTKKSGFTGRQFARIIQEQMVAALKTNDLNVRLRPDLIVLRETSMPAALAEVAFMTNKQDRESLRSESFRQTAAGALCSSVMEALDRMA